MWLHHGNQVVVDGRRKAGSLVISDPAMCLQNPVEHWNRPSGTSQKAPEHEELKSDESLFLPQITPSLGRMARCFLFTFVSLFSMSKP